MLLLLFILSLITNSFVRTAALPQNGANIITTGPTKTDPKIDPIPIDLSPFPSLPPTPTDPLPVVASNASPTVAATSDSPATSFPINSTAENPSDIPGLNSTDLSNPGRSLRATPTDLRYSAHCWSTRQVHPITNPPDCNVALQLLFKEGSALEMVTWTAPRSWSVKSCAILLTPLRSSDVADTFTRLDIVYAFSHIQRRCVNPVHGFRGGHMSLGPKDLFYVSVEPLH